MRSALTALLATLAVPVLAQDDVCGPRMDTVRLPALQEGAWLGPNYSEPFVLGRVSDAGVSSFRMGRVAIRIRAQSHRWEDTAVHRLIARQIAALPGVAVQQLPPGLTVELAGDFPFASVEGDDYRVQIPHEAVELDNDGTPYLHTEFARVLLHEFAHVLDYQGGWSDTAAWRNAVAASPCRVSDYAAVSEQEDFAESTVAWLAYYALRVPHHVEEPEDWRYRRAMREQRQQRNAYRRDYRKRLGARFSVLNRLMHGRGTP